MLDSCLFLPPDPFNIIHMITIYKEVTLVAEKIICYWNIALLLKSCEKNIFR